jgi:hypothetical protein
MKWAWVGGESAGGRRKVSVKFGLFETSVSIVSWCFRVARKLGW